MRYIQHLSLQYVQYIAYMSYKHTYTVGDSFLPNGDLLHLNGDLRGDLRREPTEVRLWHRFGPRLSLDQLPL